MASALDVMVNCTVCIVTCDGRTILGTLSGFDQTINLILKQCRERVYSPEAGVEEVELGCFKLNFVYSRETINFFQTRCKSQYRA